MSHDRAGQVKIRVGTPADAGLLAELGERTFRETYAPDTRPEDLDALVAGRYRPEQVAAVLAERGSQFLIAEVEGAAVGFALIRDASPGPDHTLPGDRPVAMDQLYVERRCHGAGVGSALLDRCRQAARHRGHDLLWLSVWERNTRAIAFYSRHGFTVAGELAFTVGEERQRDLLMALPL